MFLAKKKRLGLGGDGDANGTVYILTVHCTVQYTARYTATARMLTSRRVDNAMRAYSTHGIYAYFCRERYCVLAYAPACIYTYILYTRINATRGTRNGRYTHWMP